MKSCCHGNRYYLMNVFTQLFFSGIEVNTFTSDSLHSIKELLFKTQYYKNHIFLAFSRQNSSLPWQPTKFLSGTSSYFDKYLKGYTCAKFGAFANKLTNFHKSAGL